MNRFFLIIIVFIFFFSSCRQKNSIIEETPPMAEQAVEKITITETQDGKLKMILESESAIIDEKNNVAVLKLPRVKFYEEGVYSAILVSESAKINLETYGVAGEGKCTITTAKNEHLQTTNLQYDPKRQIIFSDNPVTIVRNKETVYGDSFESDTKLENIVIRRQRIIIEKDN
ncbi:MAG: LPS export ABC transporter periplasmic protein LptC [Elusimicrobiota bacterium]|jgi:LPS export ABC transporter protein LptC|nr:LPS export ABC transporter periplasmic protein LptC [Elusimicrobiota bacterium]